MQVVFLDLDGVLVDFVGGAFAHHGKSLPMREVRWDFPKQLGFEDAWAESFWAGLGYDFWANLDWTAEGQALLAQLEGLFGDRIALLTSPAKTSGCAEGKLAWIGRHLPKYARRYFIGPPKELIAGPGKILVDDHEENTRKFAAAGGRAILVPRPWNCRRHETDNEGRFNVARLAGEIDAVRRHGAPADERFYLNVN
jgi:hypothetical protein